MTDQATIAPVVIRPKTKKGYDFDDQLKPLTEHGNRVPLPNFERAQDLLSISDILNDIAARGHMMKPVWDYALLPERSKPEWAQFFFLFGAGQGLGFDGRGYVIAWAPSYPKPDPVVGKFALCDHHKVDDPGANHSRGWHPGHCEKCGIDMTVDSGD